MAQGHPYGSHPRAAGASPRPTSVHSIDFFGILSPYPLSFGGRLRTPAPTGIMDKKRRAHNVRPYKRERGKLPPHPSGLRPATFPPGGRLRKNKKGQVFDLSLKTQRRSGASQKVLLPTFLSRKVGGRNFSQKLPCFSPLLSNLIRKCKFSFRRLDTAPLGEYHRNDTNLRQNTGRRGIFTPGARGGLPCGEDF